MNRQATSRIQNQTSMGRPLGAVWAFAVRWRRWVLPVVSAFAVFHSLTLQDELVRAAWQGDLNKVRTIANCAPYLLQKGLMQNLTPLMAATQGNRVAVVRFLLSRGVDVHGRSVGFVGNEVDETALAVARRKGFTEIVNLLKAAGAKY